MLIKKDIFLIRLIQEVVKWYDTHYIGKDKEKVCNIHQHTIYQYYDKARFANTDNLCNERKLFLTEVQVITELRYNDSLI